MSHEIDEKTAFAVRQFLDLIAGSYPIAGAVLFGSRARGDFEQDSDADLAVILEGEKAKIVPIALEMADVAFDVLLDSGVLVSPLPIWLSDWQNPEEASNPRLLENIRRDGVWVLPLDPNGRTT